MNPWSNDYGMPNQFGMPPHMMPQPGMPGLPTMGGPGMPGMGMPGMPPLLPPMCMMPDINQAPPVAAPTPLIGPVQPEGVGNSSNDTQMEDVVEVEPSSDQPAKSNYRDKANNRNDRRERNNDRDRLRRRSRSRDRHRNDRPRSDHDERGSQQRNSQQRRSSPGNQRNGPPGNQRNAPSGNQRRRERPSKWSNPDNDEQVVSNAMTPISGMMPYNMMGQQPMDMANMSNMPNMMPSMTMMPNMMDPNMIMMSQQMLIPNQPIFFSTGVLLPALPGTSIPNRREKPPGCRTIFIGGMPHGTMENVTIEIFSRFGSITDVKLHRQGIHHVRFESGHSVERAFQISGYRFKLHEQMENEATTLFVDYALNREDQNNFEKNQRYREPTPPRIEPFTPANLATISEKIKNGEDFIEAAHTVSGWLDRGECNKKYSNQFYSLIQAANNHVRRLFTDKMQLDDEFQEMRSAMKEKYLKLITQFEQVAKILGAAKHQRVSDHFTKQQRRNIEMWLKMTEEVENIKEEFNTYFDDEDTDKIGKSTVAQDKYDELKKYNENLMFELEGYRNEAHLAKDEAERKFEKFKAQFIANQALINPKQVYPPLPPPPMLDISKGIPKPEPPPPTPDDIKSIKTGQLSQNEAKLVSIMTAFLLVHPLGATLDYIFSYVRSMLPSVPQGYVSQILHRYNEIFSRKTTGIGPNIEHRWTLVAFSP